MLNPEIWGGSARLKHGKSKADWKCMNARLFTYSQYSGCRWDQIYKWLRKITWSSPLLRLFRSASKTYRRSAAGSHLILLAFVTVPQHLWFKCCSSTLFSCSKSLKKFEFDRFLNVGQGKYGNWVFGRQKRYC